MLLRRPLLHSLLFVALGLALTLAPPLASADAPLGASVRVNDDTGTTDQECPSVAVDTRGNTYVLWTDYRWDLWHSGIYFSRRDAATGVWSANEKVNDSDVRHRGTGSIAVDLAGNVYALFWDQRNGPPEYPFLGRAYDVYFSRRDAATGAWSANVRVSDEHVTINAGWPNIAVDGAGNAYAIWNDNRNGLSDSADDKTSSRQDVWFAKRDASTGAWSADVPVNDQAVAWQEYSRGLGIDGSGNLYAVWQDSRNDPTGSEAGTDIYFSRRDASTGAWSANVPVNDDSGSVSQTAYGVAVDAAGNVHAVWLDKRRGDWDLYYSRRDAATGAWSANVRVNDVDVFAGSDGTWAISCPSIAVDPAGMAVYVVWADNRTGDFDIYFATTSPEGKKAYVPFVARAYPSGW